MGCAAMAQQKESYKVEIDLTSVVNDQIPVVITPPVSKDSISEYHLAKIVPGTYSISDFGRFVKDFTALSLTGDTLKSDTLSVNRWRIENNGAPFKVTYKVNDTRDEFDGYNAKSKNVVFEPGGTDINAEKDLFVMNTFGFVGYVQGLKTNPYEVKIKHSPSVFGASALKKVQLNDQEDVFKAEDFNFLADGPILYCKPDTTSKQIANAEILVSVYSPNNVLTSKEIMDNITDLMIAQSKYLGGELPIEKYAYLVILFDDETLSGAYGALEHSYSSLYFLPERAGDRLGQIVRDISAHEFFHIVTPLNIHAEQIGDFDYIDPKMSAHLWLYEGVTEYSSIHVQAKYDLYSNDTFLDEIADKMGGAERFGPDVSFTEMSANILTPEYEPMYGNVYQKGALIGMCLDLHILKYTNGEKDLQWVMRQLAKKYGKQLSFKDDELFDVITSLTAPEVGEFLEKHVAGAEPLPYDKVLSWAGVSYSEPSLIKVISVGNLSFTTNSSNQLVIADVSKMNSFGRELGLEKGDALVAINGMEMTLANAGEVINRFKDETKAGDKVKYTVAREVRGKLRKRKLKARAVEVEVSNPHELRFIDNPSAEQQALLDAWIGLDE